MTEAHAQEPEVTLTPVPLSDREYLRVLASADFDILDRIAQCESKWRMVWNYRHAENPEYYTAYGFFQITRGTAHATDASLDRTIPQENIRLAVKLYRKSGTVPWNASRSCWAKK